MTTQTPMAFLLVKFQGNRDEPMTKADAEQMFTTVGSGTMNVIDWFHDNTHGHIDMSGNAVFGWLQLTETVDGYTTKRTNGTYGRTKIIDLGRAAAAAAGFDLSRFTAVVVVTNVEVDLFGGSGIVCCTAATAGKQVWERQTAPSVLCQEMIHSLGVYNHARRHGSNADYSDPYDVMSMFNAWPGHHPIDATIPVGPGLNAAFMKRCGWLDTTRAAPIGQVTLRPLHRRDLTGALYSLWWVSTTSSIAPPAAGIPGSPASCSCTTSRMIPRISLPSWAMALTSRGVTRCGRSNRMARSRSTPSMMEPRRRR